jgi:hypothetical protein
MLRHDTFPDSGRPGRYRLMASIGHELQHAVEVLSDPAVTDSHSMFFFYKRLSGDTGRFETRAAIDAGLDVLAEVRAHSRGR